MLDPRTRVSLLLLLILGLAATRHLGLLAAALGLACLTALWVGAGQRLAGAMRGAAFLACLVYVLSLLSGQQGAAVAAVLRLLAMVAWSVLVFGSMTPHQLGAALRSGGVPFPAAFVLMTALQFVPVISRRAASVRDAQRARGLAIDTPLGSLRYAPALLLPLLYQSFKLADELAETLEMRGFARPGRTQRRHYRLSPGDWIVLCLASLATTVYLAQGGR